MKIQIALMAVAVCAGCGAEGPEAELEEGGVQQSALSNKDFDVVFSGCAEFAGIGFVPAARARPLVPAEYALAGDAQNAIAVVRVARCQNAIVDGKSVGPTLTSQIGITIAGGDATADINNYTIAYTTNQAKLHARYQAAGLETDKAKTLSLELVGAQLTARSSSSKTPEFKVLGTATVPTNPPSTFIASWWADGRHGVVQSRTAFPNIRFGDAVTTLTTPQRSELADLIGGRTLTFAALDSYNTFASADLEVRVTD